MKFSVGRLKNWRLMQKESCSMNCAVTERTWQGKLCNCADEHWAQQLGGFSNYVQRGFTKDIFGFVDSLFICLFSRGQCDAVSWCSSGQAPLHLSAKLIWEVFCLLGELLTNTPPSLTHPRQWNQPERLPLLSELLWELVVLKSCDWLCGNLLANPSATR